MLCNSIKSTLITVKCSLVHHALEMKRVSTLKLIKDYNFLMRCFFVFFEAEKTSLFVSFIAVYCFVCVFLLDEDHSTENLSLKGIKQSLFNWLQICSDHKLFESIKIGHVYFLWVEATQSLFYLQFKWWKNNSVEPKDPAKNIVELRTSSL